MNPIDIQSLTGRELTLAECAMVLSMASGINLADARIVIVEAMELLNTDPDVQAFAA